MSSFNCKLFTLAAAATITVGGAWASADGNSGVPSGSTAASQAFRPAEPDWKTEPGETRPPSAKPAPVLLAPDCAGGRCLTTPRPPSVRPALVALA